MEVSGPSQSHVATVSQSGGRSWRRAPFWDSWPDFGCGQDSCFFVCRGAFSLSRGRVNHVTGHNPYLRQAIYIYMYILTFLYTFLFHYYNIDNWSVIYLTVTRPEPRLDQCCEEWSASPPRGKNPRYPLHRTLGRPQSRVEHLHMFDVQLPSFQVWHISVMRDGMCLFLMSVYFPQSLWASRLSESLHVWFA
jgi:hypothetical protein